MKEVLEVQGSILGMAYVAAVQCGTDFSFNSAGPQQGRRESGTGKKRTYQDLVGDQEISSKM